MTDPLGRSEPTGDALRPTAERPRPTADARRPAADGPPPAAEGPPAAERERRPWIERIGLVGIALVLATLFGAVAAAAWSGGEPFLAAMGALGCLMTIWVGALTVVRG